MDEDDKYSLHYELLYQQENITFRTHEGCTPTWATFQSWATKGYNEYCHCRNFRKDEEDFLMNCISLVKAARNEFYESRLTETKIQLLEAIPKTKKSIRKTTEKKMIWLKKKLSFCIILTTLACKILILKFSWAMKSQLRAFILQKEVWLKRRMSLNC